MSETLIVITRKEPKCSYCDAAKNLLSTVKKDYIEYDISSEFSQELIRTFGVRTVPAIFIYQPKEIPKEITYDYLGGFNELQRYIYEL